MHLAQLLPKISYGIEASATMGSALICSIIMAFFLISLSYYETKLNKQK